MNDTDATRWSVGGLFLEALAERDFVRLADCFTPDATMRALLPRGHADYSGSGEIVEAFRFWFATPSCFEVVDGSIGDVGGRLHVSWRLRVNGSPRGDQGWHVIEQHAYLRAADRIELLDLLCSGFIPEPSLKEPPARDAR